MLFVVGAGFATLMLTREPPVPQAAKPETNEKDQKLAEQKRQLEEERKKLDEDRKKVEDKEKRLKFTQLLADADAALAAREYARARDKFNEALLLVPEDVKARSGLIQAETNLALGNVAAGDKEKKQAEYNRLMALGKEKMEGKEYKPAVTAFEGALQVMSGIDAAASTALMEAKEALEKDQADKKVLAEYNLRMEAGRVAMLAQRYDDAVKEYLAALASKPGDGEATRGLGNAQKRIGDLADADKRRNALAQTIDRGRIALQAKRYGEAIDALEVALKLQPGNAEALQGLREARKALAENKAEYNRQMALADAARLAGRITEAFRCYNEALNVFPNDERARRAVTQLRQLGDKMVADQADYLRLMNLGAVSLNNRAFLDARNYFTQALLLAPTDAEAIAGLRAANDALNRVVKNRDDLVLLVTAARNAMTARNYPAAIKAANDVLAMDPDNVEMQMLIRKARYSVAMANGQAAQQGKRWNEAIRYYEEALSQQPGDPLARNFLAQCRASAGTKPK